MGTLERHIHQITGLEVCQEVRFISNFISKNEAMTLSGERPRPNISSMSSRLLFTDRGKPTIA